MENIDKRSVVSIRFPQGYEVPSIPLTLEEMLIAVPVGYLQQRLVRASQKKYYEAVRADGLYEGCMCTVLPSKEGVYLVHEEVGNYISQKLICHISSIIRQVNAPPRQEEIN